MPHRIYSQNLWRYALVFLCFGLEIFRNFVMFRGEQSGLVGYLIACLGGLPATGQIDILSLFFFFVPNIMLLYCVSDFMRRDCAINYAYVFTRLGRKDRWLFQKTRQLLLTISALFAVIFAAVFLVGLFAGMRVNPGLILPLIAMYILNVLTVFFLSFAQNFLSLRHGSAVSFLSTILFYALSIILALALIKKNAVLNLIIMLLPATSQMYLWHQGRAAEIGYALNGFSLPFSYILLLAYSIILYFIAHAQFQRLDMAQMITEE